MRMIVPQIGDFGGGATVGLRSCCSRLDNDRIIVASGREPVLGTTVCFVVENMVFGTNL